MARSCKLPKIVRDAALPRHVNAACQILGDGTRVFYVAAGRHEARGDVTGRAASPYFQSPRTLAKFIRENF